MSGYFRAAVVVSDDCQYLDREFDEVSANLSRAKDAVEDACRINGIKFVWLMRIADPLAKVKKNKYLRDVFGVKFVSNALLKMHEIIRSENLLLGSEERVFCNAELPGAFLYAIHHAAVSKVPPPHLRWVASSYDPADSATVLNDEYGLYAKYPDRWLMGAGKPGKNGDITDAHVVAGLAVAARQTLGSGGATLYTSDAGIGVAPHYNRQEELTARINFGQIVCGLLSLAAGGTLVTKMFTFLRRESRDVLALLARLFGEVSIVKPFSSKACNSEVYIVAKGFLGVSMALGDELVARVARGDLAPASGGVADRSLLVAAGLLADRQMRALAAVARAAGDAHGTEVLARNTLAAGTRWINAGQIATLPPDKYL